jgi:hypothetical protein
VVIEGILHLGLSGAEERIVAAACLEEVKLTPGMFPRPAEDRMHAALEQIGRLPRRWARELSFETLWSEGC